MDSKDLANRFAYHAPRDEETKRAHEWVRGACLDLAEAINEHTAIPDGREKSLAVTHLEEVMMWANAAIARRPA